MPPRVGIIGLHQAEYQHIRAQHFGPIVHHEYLPKLAVKDGKLLLERSSGSGLIAVDKLVFYGIFEHDLDFIAGLALWGGPCFPNPLAMLDCRLKIPCLVRALQYTRFPGPWRGYLSPGVEVSTPRELVAKWGNWHCGENKERVQGDYLAHESSVLEPFFPGEAVRIVLIGDRHWQIRLTGDDWLKSIHPADAGFMPVDPELLEDSINIRDGLGLDFLGNDYIVGEDGQKYLLEVNHIPNVTRFPELREAYLEEVLRFLQQ
ncbi:MAG: hypothetical protein AAF840_06675 [Bacteroidota bacterium]